MKRNAAFVLVAAMLALVGCASKPDPAPARQAAVQVDEPNASPVRGECEAAGGICRKSSCRVGEAQALLECGTERGCCVPVQ